MNVHALPRLQLPCPNAHLPRGARDQGQDAPGDGRGLRQKAQGVARPKGSRTDDPASRVTFRREWCFRQPARTRDELVVRR